MLSGLSYQLDRREAAQRKKDEARIERAVAKAEEAFLPAIPLKFRDETDCAILKLSDGDAERA